MIAFTPMSTDFVVVETSNNTLLLLHMLIFVVNILKVLAHICIKYFRVYHLLVEQYLFDNFNYETLPGLYPNETKKNVDLICDESKRDALNMLFCDIIAQRALKPYLFKK